MADVVRLQAEAEEAKIRSEMARSRLQTAKGNLHRLGARWSRTKRRGLIAQSAGAAARSRHRSSDE
jgi:hypothetical protein